MEAGGSVISGLPHPEALAVPRGILEKIVPRGDLEEAGALLGTVSGGEAVVSEAVPLAWGVGGFRVDPVKWMRTVLDGEERGLEYIGMYHTHVRGRARPSPLDVRYMMECPGEVWLIVTPEEARAWVWGGSGLTEVLLRVL